MHRELLLVEQHWSNMLAHKSMIWIFTITMLAQFFCHQVHSEERIGSLACSSPIIWWRHRMPRKRRAFCNAMQSHTNKINETCCVGKWEVYPPLQKCYRQLLFLVEVILPGLPKIGTVVTGNNFGELSSRGLPESLAGSCANHLPTHFQNAQEEHHLPLPIARCGSFHGLWTSRLQAVVVGFVTVQESWKNLLHPEPWCI